MNDWICNCIYCSGGYEPLRTIDYDKYNDYDEYCKGIDDEYLDEMDRQSYDEYEVKSSSDKKIKGIKLCVI